MLLGLLSSCFCVFSRFSDIIDEATFLGYHTQAVRSGLKLGFMLFIASEIMLFFGFPRAFFHSSLCPAIEIGSIFPPEGIHTTETMEFPLFILLF